MPRSELRIIKQHFGNRPFRVREAVDAGIPRHQIYRLRDEGDLVVLSRGVMQSVDSDPAMNTEFAALAARVPDGTICLSSGLSYWDLSDELPARIDLAVPRGAHWPKIDMPATRLHRFAAETFGLDRLGSAHRRRRAVLDLFGAAVHRRRDARAPHRRARRGARRAVALHAASRIGPAAI